jgi:glycerol-3-phosphate acyltransferase PlsY
MLINALAILGAYLIGSISTAVITCRLMGLPDPRDQGSGNPGATNVLRIGGKQAAIVTLAGDLLKGLVPVLLARGLGVEGVSLGLVALAAFLGHLYPVFFGFQGGKGVATAGGAVIGLSLPVAGAAVLTWVVVAAATRLSSLAALIAAALTPIYLWLLSAPAGYLAPMIVMAGLLIWRHGENIRRLRSGSEGRIGEN